MPQLLKKLPIGVTSLAEMIEENYIYVDKTKFLSSLVNQKGPFFLSRPRRFGKSTLVDTLDNIFSGNNELFTDTYIGKHHLLPDKTYKVLHFSFASIKDAEYPFAVNFKHELIRVFNDQDLTVESVKDLSVNDVLRKYLDKQPISSLVLLIDEYDAPLTEVLNNQEKFASRRELFTVFYSTIKDFSKKFRFIFITGVTKYSHLSMFSAFNNLRDLSLDSVYGDIAGYTQKELEIYFKVYLEKAIDALNAVEHNVQYTYDKIVNELKYNYDGYSFDYNCQKHVYNPWSILMFLNAPQNGFRPYWSETGGAKPALLVQYLNNIDSISKEQNFEKFLDLNYEHLIDTQDLSPSLESIDSKDFGLLPILYQAGYFCIKQPEQADCVYIGIPNLEVKKSFVKIIFRELCGKLSCEKAFAPKLALSIMRAFDQKDTAMIKDRLNILLTSLSYQGIVKFNEASYRDFIAALLLFAGASNIIKEHINAYGRADLTFESSKHAFVCEFKLAHHESEVPKLAAQAKDQIKQRRYAVLPTDKTVIAYVIVILHQVRNDKQDSRFEIMAVETV